VDGKPVENVNEVDINDVVKALADKVAELTVQNAVLTAQLKKALTAW
jgi:hypothetical protein